MDRWEILVPHLHHRYPNDTLHFKSGDQRIRQTIRYEDYKQFGAETKITFTATR